MDMVTIHIKVEPAVRRQLQKQAKDEDLVISDIVRRAIREYFKTLPQPEKEQVAS